MLKNGLVILLMIIIGSLPATALAGRTERSAKAVNSSATSNKDELEDKLNEFMQRIDALGYTGALLVAKDGKIILEKAYGLANRGEKIPFSVNTAFDIGSNVKDFTKMSILQLAAKGKINLTDPITKYFENVPADKTSITIEQLMKHTAGLRQYSGPDPEKITRDDFLKRVFAAPLIAEPGKEQNYSNPGYSMLAAIIELVTRQSFEQYVAENILKPAGMTRTGYVLPQWKPSELAHSYMDETDRGTTFDFPHLDDGNSWNLRGNGGMLSTLGDMYKFHLALETEKLLSNDLKEKLFPQNQPIMLVGGDGFHLFLYMRDPANKIVIIGASTVAAMKATELIQQILPLLRGKEYKLPPPTIKLEAAVMAKYEGTYKLPAGSELNVTTDKGRLMVAATDQEAFSLLSGIDAGMTAELNKLNDRAGRIVEASAKGDYTPLFEAYEREVPLEQIKMRQGGFWQQLTQRLGNFKGFKVLGTSSNQKSRQQTTMREPSSATSVQLDFEKGAAYVQYLWEDGKLAGVRPLSKPVAFEFIPQTADTFVIYDFASGETSHIRFSINGDNTVKELILGGNIAAVKTK